MFSVKFQKLASLGHMTDGYICKRPLIYGSFLSENGEFFRKNEAFNNFLII